jgi:hypothetical protein
MVEEFSTWKLPLINNGFIHMPHSMVVYHRQSVPWNLCAGKTWKVLQELLGFPLL